MSSDIVITVPTLAGLVGTLLTAVLARGRDLGATFKRWLAIAVFIALTAIGLIAAASPESWQQVALWIGAAVGVGQAVYAALKPTGLLDWLSGDGPVPKYAIDGSTGDDA